MFEGSCCALVTPMTQNGDLDEKTLAMLTEWHVAEGTQALVIAGSTGEGSALSSEELKRALKIVLDAAQKRIPIIAGTGTNNTRTTIEKTQMAQELGVDGCLIVTPYYNRPTQAGLIAHFQAIAKAVDIPIILYNVPSRTACDMLPETIATLSYLPNVIGVKEATGKLERLIDMIAQCAPGFKYYSGDDPTALAFIKQGGHGVISITANVVPGLMQKMCGAAVERHLTQAQAADIQLQPLHRMLVAEPNPIPVKWAMGEMGKIQNVLRLPLTTLSQELHDKMKQAMQVAGIYATSTAF